jgi:hypothetical protein
MIKDGMVYECLDLRRGVPQPMDGIVMLTSIPNGFEVWHWERWNKRVEFEDDEQLEEVATMVTFQLPEGSVHFMPLELADFERFEGQSMFGTPKFKDTAQLQDYFRVRIEHQT